MGFWLAFVGPRSAAVPVNKVDNVGVLHLLHDQDLIDDQLLLGLLLQVDLLDSHLT